LIKRLTLWRARSDVGSQEALRRWQGDHASLVERVPGLRQYRQTLCADAPDGTPPSVLGFGEVLFEDVEAAREALASAEWAAVVEDAKGFMDFDSVTAVWVDDDSR
jgi:uncharacterized protein (TIGR02118 family)